MRRHAIVVVVSLAFAALFGLVVKDAMTHPHASAEEAAADTVVIQLRFWQRVTDPEELWLSARTAGGRWDELGTFRLPDGRPNSPPYARLESYPAVWQFQDVTLTVEDPGVEPRLHAITSVYLFDVPMRVWQRLRDPSLVWIQLRRDGVHSRRGYRSWRPSVMAQVALDDGFSSRGHYRYGDLEIAAPRNNPGLSADREHLLALRDVLEGDGTELDWTIERPVADWQGVSLSGTPPRVTELDLAGRGLNGELWGWLGELGELTVLRLERNALAGTLPHKLSLLSKLQLLRLGGNAFSGCIPAALRHIEDHDLDELVLPDCPLPLSLPHQPVPGAAHLSTGAYAVQITSEVSCGWDCVLFFDVPPDRSVTVSSNCSGNGMEVDYFYSIFDSYQCGYGLHDADDNNIWLYVDHETGFEYERSHYSGCVYDCVSERSPAAFIEQLAASAYVLSPWNGERTQYP